MSSRTDIYRWFSIGLLLSVIACQGSPPAAQRAEQAEPASEEKKAEQPEVSPLVINGAGATFPYPLYSKWAEQYQQSTTVKVNYQPIGSGGGIAQIKARTVNFGASDAPLDTRALEEAGLVQFPMIMGGVVPVLNVEGIEPGALRLTPEVIVDIFLGRIKMWNDRRLVKINPDLKLPAKEISVVHRADGSGTTWIFTNYLARVSENWRETVGSGKAVDWPTGVGGKGNEGVAAYVRRVSGAIGYVEFAYALKHEMTHTLLENRAGRFVGPTVESFQSAAANAQWKKAPGFYMLLIDQPGDASWPITGASFILMHQKQRDPAMAKALVDYFSWCFSQGTKQAASLHYVPMPKEVIAQVKGVWRDQITSSGKKPF